MSDDLQQRIQRAIEHPQNLGEMKDAGRREAVEDLYWSVLSSKAFLFNH